MVGRFRVRPPPSDALRDEAVCAERPIDFVGGANHLVRRERGLVDAGEGESPDRPRAELRGIEEQR